MPDLIDSILPENEINLLAGPSGAGKTRWLLETLVNQWCQGHPVLGFASHPCPWAYVAGDRSLASVQRTLSTMGIPATSIPTIPAWDSRLSILGILDAIGQTGAKFAVIEAFGSFVEPPGNSKCVKAFLNAVSHEAMRMNLTILGVVESPKQKPFERYENPRWRVSGAAGWAHFTETIFLVEPAEAKSNTTKRKLYVCPRNGALIEKDGEFDSQGHLIFP